MVTRGEVRDRVRLRLEHTGVATLWSDTEVLEGLRWMLDEYSARWPREDRVTVPALGGERELTAPAGVLRVARVVDPAGQVIMPRSGAPSGYVADEVPAWEWWGGNLVFTQPLVAGDYTIWGEWPWTFPVADGEEFPVPEVDVTLIVAGAACWCLDFRAMEEWKRGAIPQGYEQRVSAAKAEYRRQLDVRRRRVTVGRVVSSG